MSRLKYSKRKEQITNSKKLEQIDLWKRSDFNNISSSIHRKERASFDVIPEFLDSCINFQKEDIESMLNAGIDINCVDKDNLTALHHACINCDLDLVVYLLSKNANINVFDKECWTPLHIAASIGSLELAKCLIDRGARLDMANCDGNLPVSLVKDDEHPDLKSFIKKEMYKRNIDEEFCRDNERRIMMEDVLAWKSSRLYSPVIDEVNKSTPLHVAASKNYIDVLNALIPLLNEQELNAQDSDGWTALHAAGQWGNREACTILIKAGIDIGIVTNANETVLDTVDPLLKFFLEEEINRSRMGTSIRGHDLLIPNDNANSRRHSITRQSVEWKKLNQSKDPVLEREMRSHAQQDSDSFIITSSVPDTSDKSLSPILTKKLKSDDGSFDQSLSEVRVIDDARTFSIVTPPSVSYQKDEGKLAGVRPQINTSNNKPDPKSYLAPICLSDGDNSTDIHNWEISNERSRDISENSSCSSESEKNIKCEEIEVKLRPRSVRDTLKEHRSTTSQLSMVMAPVKCDESEASRKEKSRRMRSNRRSTQGINLETIEAIRERENANKPVTEALVDVTDAPLLNNQKSNPKEEIKIENTVVNVPPSIPQTQREISFSNVLPKLHIGRQLSALMKPNIATNPKRTESMNAIISPLRQSDGLRGPEEKNFANRHSTDFCSAANEKPIVKNISDDHKVHDSGNFIARAVHVSSRPKTNDIPDHPNISVSKTSNSLSQGDPYNNITHLPGHNKTSDILSTDDMKSCRAIATRLANDQTVKQELQIEIIKLKQEIKDIKSLKDCDDSSARHLKAETERTGDDKFFNLETELARTKEDNKKLKLQNEALLRVISKIQQQLEFFYKTQSQD